MSWKLGLKCNALYRDGSKLSQPLNTSASTDIWDEEEDELQESLAHPAAVQVAEKNHPPLHRQAQAYALPQKRLHPKSPDRRS